MSRPTTLVVVFGTATEVGKTWAAARLCEELVRRGHRVAARKPVQSFDPAADEPTDAEVLATATGETSVQVCPEHRWLEVPMAPPMAADVLGRPAPSLDELLGELAWPDPRVAVGLVETVGGVRSPLADDGDSRDLARRLEPDVTVLVADAGLGVIDAVRTGVDAVDPLSTVVFLNRFDGTDDLHRRNVAWLRDRDGLDVVTEIAALADRIAPDSELGHP